MAQNSDFFNKNNDFACTHALNCSKFEKNVIFGKKLVAILNQNCRISIKIYSKLTAQNIKFLKQFCQFFKKSSDFWNKNSDFCMHMLKIVDFWIKSCQTSIKIDRSKSKIYENFVSFWKKDHFWWLKISKPLVSSEREFLIFELEKLS